MKNFFYFAVSLFFTIASYAAPPSVATGDAKTSTYHKLQLGMNTICPATVTTSTGGVANAQMVSDNSVMMAYLPMDYLYYLKGSNPAMAAKFKLLVPLYREELHFVARSTYSDGGMMGFFKDEKPFKTIMDMSGKKVGSWGGSWYSAKVFLKSASIGIAGDVINFPDVNTAADALKKGNVDVLVFAAGAPSETMSHFGAGYTLLDVPSDKISALTKTGIYAARDMTYSGRMTVHTVGAMSALMTRTFRDQDTIQQINAYRDCYTKAIFKLSDMTGTHPKWQEIDPAASVVWDKF